MWLCDQTKPHSWRTIFLLALYSAGHSRGHCPPEHTCFTKICVGITLPNSQLAFSQLSSSHHDPTLAWCCKEGVCVTIIELQSLSWCSPLRLLNRRVNRNTRNSPQDSCLCTRKRKKRHFLASGMEAVISSPMEKEFGRIPCCECASPILPNLKNLCSTCLNVATDLAESLPRQVALQQCTGCQRYLVRPQVWVIAIPESRELMAVCLKQLKGFLERSWFCLS